MFLEANVNVSLLSDLVPAFRTAGQIHAELKRYCFFPPYRSNRAFDACTDGRFKIAPTQLPHYLLPDSNVDARGRLVEKPPGW